MGHVPARRVCLVTLSLSEDGSARFGGRPSSTDVCHTIPYHHALLEIERRSHLVGNRHGTVLDICGGTPESIVVGRDIQRCTGMPNKTTSKTPKQIRKTREAV